LCRIPYPAILYMIFFETQAVSGFRVERKK
jgi:hypothetical protein